MNLWEKYWNSFQEHATKTAFCIGNNSYSYSDFSASVAGCQQLLHEKLTNPVAQPVGVMCHDSLETFAAIFAIWFSGAHFVPLHPQHPERVNQEKIKQSGLYLILDSNPDTKHLCSNGITGTISKPEATNAGLAYILFTSGSTGSPKGVPISTTNLNAFVEGFLNMYPDLNSSDHFLQTYDLTSDAAFTGYLIPLLLGATVYTIPSEGFKYLNIVKYLQQYEITWTQFTPSVLNYLRPYFNSIRCNSLKHSQFGGEALSLGLVTEWAACVPNAEISNIYGPTETTITCAIHRTTIQDLPEKVNNGIISIGKPIGEVKILILTENNSVAGAGEKGELCIGGKQVMANYLSNPGNGKNPFFTDENGQRYYRSGDLVFQDEDGCLFYCGRIDDQLKINGYRIEPAEIELAVSRVSDGSKSKAYEFRNKTGTESIVVFIEQTEVNPEILKEQLRAFLPAAVLPEKIVAVRNFPLNPNGKVDKNALFAEYSSQIYE